ncbi:MAG: hypothetical protein HY529_01040 [Chloroflexi bacterium]|nr:hypothetical protein [Chloroflexota bacterium]
MYEILRAIHVLAGIFLGGVTMFELFILNPGLRRLGAATQGAVTGAITSVMSPAMGVSSVLLLGTGIAMALTGRDLASLAMTVWGWAMIITAIAMLAFLVNGLAGVMPTSNRIKKLAIIIAGRTPTAEEGQQMKQLSAKMDKLQNLQIVFVMVGLVLMISGRFL